MFTSYSQGIKKLNCDSLFAEFEVIEPKYHVVWEMTEFIGNMDSVRKVFMMRLKIYYPIRKNINY